LTACHIGHFDPYGKFRIIYSRIFKGKYNDPNYELEELTRLAKAYRVKLIGADRGGGRTSIGILQKNLPGIKVIPFDYRNTASMVKWMRKSFPPYYALNRMEVMKYMFSVIREGKIAFPK